MYEHRTAYRHADNTVEGFIGTGGTKAKAKADAIEQIGIKLDCIAEWRCGGVVFDRGRIINVLSSMTPAEVESVRKDWNAGTRY